jgi:hypothetical protein
MELISCPESHCADRCKENAPFYWKIHAIKLKMSIMKKKNRKWWPLIKENHIVYVFELFS